MALRIRTDGRILCAAMHPAEPGDTYVDDGLHYQMSVEHKVIGTEPMEKHEVNGQWWWMGNIPEGIEIAEFYKKPNDSPLPSAPGKVDGVEKWEDMHPDLQANFPITLDNFPKDFLNQLDFMQGYNGNEVQIRMGANVIRKIILSEYNVDICRKPNSGKVDEKENDYWKKRCEELSDGVELAIALIRGTYPMVNSASLLRKLEQLKQSITD